MNLRKLILNLCTFIFIVLWFGGIVSYIFYEQPLPESKWAAPLFLMLAGLIVLISSQPNHAVSLIIVGLIGFISEIIGVHTGLPFGNYYYTNNVKPLIFNVPIVMISAWIVLVAYTLQILLKTKLKRNSMIVAGSALMVCIDLLIDPVAIGPMKFWVWIDNGFYYGIPFLNFFGWFLVSLIAFIFIAGIKVYNIWHEYIGVSMILFFTLIAFAEEILFAGIAGIGILLIHLILYVMFNQENKRHLNYNYYNREIC